MEHTWFTRLEAERRAGNLTRAERDVLSALGRLLAMGDHTPSEARLASEAGCSRRTVARAKAKGRALGILGGERRFDSAGGLRRERPCVYHAETPQQPVTRRVCQRGKRVPESNIKRSIQQQLAALPPVTAELRALWEERLSGGGRRVSAP